MTTPRSRWWLAGLKRAGLALSILIILLISVLLVKTVLLPTPPVGDVVTAEQQSLDGAAARRLSTAVTFQTVSSREAGVHDPATFTAFHEFLEDSLPRVHETLARRKIAQFSLLYKWPGRDTTLKPVLVMAHQDVVPATDSQSWTQPPFSGVIEDGYVWGRGTMDDKSALMGCLEAAEQLIASGFQPARTVYFAFGHDEEIGGPGALAMAEHLTLRDIRFAFVLDEGGFIAHELLPDIEAPIALIGIAEKGYLTIELTVEQGGGHSSRPPAATAIGIVSRAVVKLEHSPFPSRLDGATREMFERLAPHMPFTQRLLIANQWLLAPLMLRMLENDVTMAALVRTTTAPTVFEAGGRETMLARQARAVVNLRILPGETVESALNRVREVVDDSRIEVRIVTARFADFPRGLPQRDRGI